LVSGDFEVRLKNGRAVIAFDLKQTAPAHGNDVEGTELAIVGMDVGLGYPFVAGGQNVTVGRSAMGLCEGGR